jgi:hypothetical protein
MQIRPDGEMDIIAAFEAVVPGSNPGRGTGKKSEQYDMMPLRAGMV